MKNALPDFENIEDVKDYLFRGYAKQDAIDAVAYGKKLKEDEVEKIKEYFKYRGIF